MLGNLSKIKNYYLLFTSYFIGFGIIIALLVSLINYNFNYSNIEDKVFKEISAEITQKEKYLQIYLNKFDRTLLSITKSELTKRFLQTNNEEDKQKVTDLFYSLSYSNKDIMQLRYIDKQGKEVIRVDRKIGTNEVTKIPQTSMQDKSNRYYFKEIKNLKEGEFWHSNIDLNIENGKIEFPLKPTYRIGIKLMDNKEFKGIIIVNILFEDVIEFLSTSHTFDIYLIDKNADIIKDPDGKNSWSKYFEDKKDFHTIMPTYTDAILENKEFNKDNIYSFSLSKLFHNQEDIKIIFKTKSTIMDELQDQAITSTSIIALTIILVAAPLSWIISIVPSNLQSTLVSTYQKLRKSADIIDKHVMFFKMDKGGILLNVSKNFSDTTGYSHTEAVGKALKSLKHPNTKESLYIDMLETLKKGQVWEGELKNIDKKGKDLWLHMVISPEFDQLQNIEAYTGIATNITNNKIIEKISITDELTQIYNRRKIEEVLNQKRAKARRYKTNFSVIFIDVDKFKSINDTFGHSLGDEVLIQIAIILKEHSRETDFVGRWGGEEFIIVCTQTDEQGAYTQAQILRKLIEESNFSIKRKVTISAGVAKYNGNENILDLISRADKALYSAKELGRNRVELAKEV